MSHASLWASLPGSGASHMSFGVEVNYLWSLTGDGFWLTEDIAVDGNVSNVLWIDVLILCYQ